jgi:hypothetical protein
MRAIKIDPAAKTITETDSTTRQQEARRRK